MRGPPCSALDGSFRLRENQTTIRTELVAGVVTFMAMAYIIFVHPQIIADVAPGPEQDAFRASVMMATCLAAALAALLMGFVANYPIALAPATFDLRVRVQLGIFPVFGERTCAADAAACSFGSACVP